MHSIKNNLLLLLLCYAAITGSGCVSRTEVYNGHFQNEKLVITNIREKSIFNNYYSQSVRLGKLPELIIDDKTTNGGVPYSADLYKDVPHYLRDIPGIAYSNANDTSGLTPVVLYLSPRRFSPADFEAYQTFFRESWPSLEKCIRLNQGYRSLRIVGLVYGTDEDFALYFNHGSGKQHTRLVVETNGDIHYETGNSLQSTNLSPKVQMPGKVIVLHQEGGDITRRMLYLYLDQHGDTPYDHFTIQEEK